MRHFLATTLILALCGCSGSSSVESNSATESYREMLRCKANLAKLSRDAKYTPRRRRAKKTKTRYHKSIEKFAPNCPSAKADTYSAGYDPKTGTTFCQGHHHSKAGLAPDYPRIVPIKELSDQPKISPNLLDRYYSPQVVEDALYSNQLPPGYPYPLPEGETVKTLSSLVTRDGVWHVHINYSGDIKNLYETWLEISLKQINLTKDQVGDQMLKPNRDGSLNVGGKTPLADEVGAIMYPETHFIRMSYQPKYLINDLGQ